MELFSNEVIEQIRAAKAARQAAQVEVKAEAIEPDEEYSNFNPIRDIEVNADPEMASKGNLWQADW